MKHEPRAHPPAAAPGFALPADAAARIVGIGNAALLAEALLGFLAPRQCPGHILIEILERVPQWAREGRVLLSGFHSPLEQQVLISHLRRAGRAVKVLARGFAAVPLATARQVVETWLNLPHVRVLAPPAGHVAKVMALVAQAMGSGSLVSDAVLAFYAIENRAVLHTNNADFSRFPTLNWRNPLQPAK